MSITILKSDYFKLNEEKSNHFTLADLVNAKNLKIDINEHLHIPLENCVELDKYLYDNSSVSLYVRIYDVDFLKRSLNIKGADPDITFLVSRYDVEKLKPLLNQNIDSFICKATIRRHQDRVCFVEDINLLPDMKEWNYNKMLELRKSLTTSEWKDLILKSIGFDFSESEGISKDLLLVRLLPYLEKTYSYIELGGYKTGKTTFAELFSNGTKISKDITVAQFYYDSKAKKEGFIYIKDVLYLDESSIFQMDDNVKSLMLQLLAGNKLEEKDTKFNKDSYASIVSQGNETKGIEKFKNRTIFSNLEKGFNPGAFFDRTNFFIPGWIIPSHHKVVVKEECDIIPRNILEDFLKVQRNKASYCNLLEDLNIGISTKIDIGRFRECVETNISGYLKLLYPDGNINIEEEIEEIEKIVTISIFGKLSVFFQNSDDYKTIKVKAKYKDFFDIDIDMNVLFRDFIEAREDKFFNEFEEFFENEESGEPKITFSEFKAKWKNDNKTDLSQREYHIEFQKEKIKVPEIFENIFNSIENEPIKTRLVNSFKTLFVYDVKEHLNKPITEDYKQERKNYFNSLFAIMMYFYTISKYSIKNEEKKGINIFMEKFINRLNQNLYVEDSEKIKFSEGNILFIKEQGMLDKLTKVHVFFRNFCGIEGAALLLLSKNISTNLENEDSSKLDIKKINETLKEINLLNFEEVRIEGKNEQFEIYLDNKIVEMREKTEAEKFMELF